MDDARARPPRELGVPTERERPDYHAWIGLTARQIHVRHLKSELLAVDPAEQHFRVDAHAHRVASDVPYPLSSPTLAFHLGSLATSGDEHH